MDGFCVSDPVVAPLLTPPQAAKDPGSMPEPSNEGPAKSGRKRGRGACAPANRRPFRTLDGTKQAKASAGEFLVLFAAKKYKVPRGRRPRLIADQKAAKKSCRRLQSVLFAEKSTKKRPARRRPFSGGCRTNRYNSVTARSRCALQHRESSYRPT